MASAPIIFGNLTRSGDVLALIGTALLQIKCEDRLTLQDMADVLGRTDDMVAKYIAGEAEMGVVAWLRANDAWGERLAEKLNGGGK